MLRLISEYLGELVAEIWRPVMMRNLKAMR